MAAEQTTSTVWRQRIASALVGLALAVAGYVVGHRLAEDDAAPTGRFRKAPRADEEQAQLDALAALGYLRGYEPAPDASGVTIRDPAAAPGLNFVVEGSAPGAVLMDMDGTVLHRWHLPFEGAFPGRAVPPRAESPHYWRRAHLFANGDVLAVFEGLGLVKVDKDSNLLWANPCAFHHDLAIGDGGRIYALSHERKILPRIHPEALVREDFVTILEPDGTVVRNVSLLEAFERSRFASHLDLMPERGDLFHTNTLELLDGSQAGRSPIFARGNALISLYTINVIAIVDLEREEVVWALSGQWVDQHEPTLLPNGRILLFDNLGHGGMSKVIEVDPFTQEIGWSYEGDADNGFHTATCGANQRLSNGNTLITESDSGRAFEVTPEGRRVWEFVNPERAGEHGELVATLFEVLRLPPDFPLDWLETGS